MLSAPDGGAFEVRRAAFHRGSDVIDNFDSFDGVVDDLGIAEVAANDLEAGSIGGRASNEDSDRF